MSLKVWIGKEYENTHENHMAQKAIAILRDVYNSLEETCHILINFDIPFSGKNKKHKHCSIDFAILKRTSFIIVEMKDYAYAIDYKDQDPCDHKDQDPCDHKDQDPCDHKDQNHCWVSYTPKETIKVKGGMEGRTPFGQVSDYRYHLSNLLKTNWTQYLATAEKEKQFRYDHFVSAMILCPTRQGTREDQCFIDKHKYPWFSFVRMNHLAESVCSICSGRDGQLTEAEIERLITKTLKLDFAHLVGNVPKRGKIEPPVQKKVVEKKVVIEKIVEKVIEKPATVVTALPSDYGQALAIYESDDSNNSKIFQFGDMFRHRILHEKKKRFKKTIIHSLGNVAEMLLSDKDDELLRRYSVQFFRLLAKLRNEKTQALSLDVDESFKTICLLTEKFYPNTIPDTLKAKCAEIIHRKERPYSITRPSKILSLRLEIKSIDKETHTFIGIDHGEDDPIGVEYTIDYSQDAPDLIEDYDKILEQGDIVSIVTPLRLNKEGDVLKPSEIVLEPDYLISPQSLGRASEWGNPEYYFWLNTLETIENNKHILLGEYANLCLENAIHSFENGSRDILKKFWPKYKLDITKVFSNFKKDDLDEFTINCEKACENLKELFTKTLPNEHKISDAHWQLEAPLYSPVYGLTARADALAYLPDKSNETYKAAVLELKSGKWDTVKQNPQEVHLCQPSFYADMLLFSLGIPRDNVKTLLYYSKTIDEKNGMLFANPSKGKSISQMIREFVRIRNSIIVVDREIRKGNIQQVFDELNSDTFKNSNWNAKFWSNYKLPTIDRILHKIQTLSDLSKAYFYRMLKFVADEAFCSRVGEDNAEIGRGGLSMLWRMSTAKRKAAGMRLSDLKLLEPINIDNYGLVRNLTFDVTLDKENANISLRQGDRVCLYVDKEDSNIANSIIYAASIESISSKKVVIHLDESQKALFFTSDKAVRYAIENAPISGFTNYKSLGAFLEGDERRQKLILNEVEPTSKESPLPCDLNALDTKYPGVSEWITHAWNAQDWYLLWGPPGTGKTSHAMRALVDVALATPKTKILLLAYTYRATDEICKMLNKRLEADGEEYLRIGNTDKCDKDLRDRLIDNLDLADRNVLRKKIETTRIFVSTVSSLSSSHSLFEFINSFDLAIVDEASQLLDVHLLSLFCAKRSNNSGPLINKFILIGDDKQLPAVVQQDNAKSRVEDELLRNQGIEDCRESLFARFKRIANENPQFIGMLSKQFRMHPSIAEFCNRYFYEGKLRNGNKKHQSLDLPDPPPNIPDFERDTLSTRLGFFPTPPIQNKIEDLKTNEDEAQKCVDIIRTLTHYNAKPPSTESDSQARPYKPDEISVIVPFRNQISCIKNKLTQQFGEEIASRISIDTVERNQGSENEVVIFSTVIRNDFQTTWLSDIAEDDDDGDELNIPIDKKLNVAITRAKERFYLLGSETVLNKLHSYDNLLNWIANHDGFGGVLF